MWLEIVRDIAIVLLAVVSIIIGILLIVTLARIRELILILRNEVTPVLTSIKDTTKTVKGTATIVTDTVVNPLVKINSVSKGALKGALYFLTMGHKPNNKASPTSVDNSRS
ncbi:MAG: hypothetical protein GXY52_07460 [Chloroflexi bacterium]|nr:hypothetical protein [Chloroflexota bacterium]